MPEQKRGRGRPPKGDDALARRLQIMVTTAEEKEIEEAVKRTATPDAGATVSTWGREVLLSAARRKGRKS